MRTTNDDEIRTSDSTEEQMSGLHEEKKEDREETNSSVADKSISSTMNGLKSDFDGGAMAMRHANPVRRGPDDGSIEFLSSNQAAKQARQGGGFFSFLRLSANVVMFVLALAFAGVYIMRCIYHEYYVPIMQRALRTDWDLMDEYTYYDRICSSLDLTATPEDASGIIYESEKTVVDQMMKHGAVMIPDILSPSLIPELRQFVVDKNAAVKGTESEYPVSQGKNRISYGIEAAEHPTVSRALKELHDNQKLKNLLEGLVGKNPALTEITAITASYGCPDQVWHSDVKADGYAAKFGRTYSHSYSLFIPLQNTTGAMGATDICPGTHYCTDSLHEVCNANKIGMHQVRGGEDHWRAGDAVLLNQQVWHRGTKHRAKGAPERIVFIVSFIGRPIDTRQLARGTYFHMKWNMWGHTWQDLADSAVSMTWPFNVLRCLHLWKPKGRDWGYDLLTASAMRIANGQGGCEPGELENLVNRLSSLGLPEWLFGTIDYDDWEAWTIFIKETLENVFDFLKHVNSAALGAYAAIVVLTSIRMHFRARSGLRCLIGNTLRILVLYGMVLGWMIYILDGVRRSPWATDVASGRTLRRPFPELEADWRVDDPAVPRGPTTLPYRHDVLIGTRLNTRKVFAYRHWIDYHPGNVFLLDRVIEFGGPQFRSYERGLPDAFSERLVTYTAEAIYNNGGRFLHQDYRTGDWRWMNRRETRAFVRLRLLLGHGSLLGALKDSIELLLDEYRFETLRGTTMSHISQANILDLESSMFVVRKKAVSPAYKLAFKKSSSEHPSPVAMRLPSQLASLHDNTNPSPPGQSFSVLRNRYWTNFPKVETPELPLFSEVLYKAKRKKKTELVPATVFGFSENNTFEIALYGKGANRHGTTLSGISPKKLTKIGPVIEGERAEANFEDRGEWFPGHVTRVRPGGVDIDFDDGDYEDGIPFDNYFPIL